MAAKEDADIPQEVQNPIARYLTTVAGPAEGEAAVTAPMPPKEPSGGGKEAEKAPSAKGEEPNTALIQQGQTAFNTSCTTCHDAQRSLDKTKSLSAWRATVRRMADKEGANIPASSHEAIATYLSSRGSGEKGKAEDHGELAEQFSLGVAVSPTYRYSGNAEVEDPGFYGDAWLSFAWQGKGPVSAQVTTCISCHNQAGQFGRLDIVDATVKFDLGKYLRSKCRPEQPKDSQCQPIGVNVEAGRFVVPFGAYYQQVNPSVDRAVSRPLIYNMGQRVQENDIGDPVLPMPYSDEGAALNVTVPLTESTHIALNGYLVNGLQGGSDGVDFFASRGYVDNNRNPAIGGRATIGSGAPACGSLRFGASVMGGRFDSDTQGFQQNEMRYLIFGADAVFRWKDLLRVQFEYAQRDSDRFGAIPAPEIFKERVSGYYLETEATVLPRWHISLFTRYDCADAGESAAPVEQPVCHGRLRRPPFHLRYQLHIAGRQPVDDKPRALVSAGTFRSCRRGRRPLGGNFLNACDRNGLVGNSQLSACGERPR